MDGGRFGAVLFLVVATAAPGLLAGGGCTGKNESRCGTKRCTNDPAPSDEEIATCASALGDEKCGARYEAALECAQSHPFCDKLGVGDQNAVLAACEAPYAGYTTCSGKTVVAPMPTTAPTSTTTADGGPLPPAPDGSVPVPVTSCTPDLGYSVLDAEFSKQLNKIVMVSTTPKALHVYDPLTAREVLVTLPSTPTSVSVGLDGMSAAVGHDGAVTFVDLAQAKVTQTWPVSIAVRDIVLAGNGFAYLWPNGGTSDVVSVKSATGEATMGNASFGSGVVAHLHPNGTSMYGADNGVSPSDIHKYTFPTGTASELYDSPYHGDYGMCGDLWLSDDGLLIFVRCGNVFRTSDLKVDDMTYKGKLSGGSMRFVESVKHRVLAVPLVGSFGGSSSTLDDAFVHEYEDMFLNFVTKRQLPCFGGAPDLWGHGRYIFTPPSGTEYYAVVQAVKYECKQSDKTCDVNQITRTPIDHFGVTRVTLK